jgi:hypothetical protein
MLYINYHSLHYSNYGYCCLLKAAVTLNPLTCHFWHSPHFLFLMSMFEINVLPCWLQKTLLIFFNGRGNLKFDAHN